ncbi:MAG: bifunctional glutamate N-acetyltransferase/amino-acid acetyltransferase ArgJ [Candidatus Thioglobus sp.]|nr:bifunctional glutamate N-acetyltransferase/amino-acid acetyltransferase ArgJ [Candidatus Thioglobus sp.]
MNLLKIKGVKSNALNAGIKNAQNSGTDLDKNSGIDLGINSDTNSKPDDTKKLDLSVILLAENTTTAAVFTQNIFCAAPVLVAKNHLQNDIRALLINTGNANAGTGLASGTVGLENAFETCKMVADELGIEPSEVLPFSTGVIGKPLPMACFEDNIKQLAAGISVDNLPQVAAAILTTDLKQKTANSQFEINGKTVSITGIAKGSGMIRPDMATMLSFIFTDISAKKSELQNCLNIAVNQSFNRITVDGDTSTNDACTLSATGVLEVRLADCLDEFQSALNAVTKSLAQQIIKDGEGATKFVEVRVAGKSSADCLEVAYTVAHSPLVKTAIFAADANWGRILAAVGRANISDLKVADVDIYLGAVCLIKNGELNQNYTEKQGAEEMAKSEILIDIKIGKNTTCESVWTTDLSFDYIKINTDYRT